MKKTLSAIALVVMLVTPASMMSDVNYQRARASERVVNALQVLSENRGYNESQRAQLTFIQGSLNTLAIDLLTEAENSGVSIEEHDKARAAQRALSILIITADVSGFTESQVITMANIRTQALALLREVRSQIVIE